MYACECPCAARVRLRSRVRVGMRACIFICNNLRISSRFVKNKITCESETTSQ